MLIEEKLRDILSLRRLRIAAAESCTGGLVADRITNIPGASEYFIGSVVAYAYAAKANLLGVEWDTLNQHGAVSEPAAREMARGALKIFKVDVAIAVTGIAGPGGALPDKPVGYTWLALAAKDGEWARNFIWDGDRVQNKQHSAQAALQFILDYLEGKLE